MTVASLARENDLLVLFESNISARGDAEPSMVEGDMALTFNFDQILTDSLLKRFPLGVINVHGSGLPADKGISPVLWAFARGDDTIRISIYEMDAGIDSGPILEQFSIPVLESDSGFSLYSRVCEEAGERLVDVVEQVSRGTLSATPQPDGSASRYWSWAQRRASSDDDCLRSQAHEGARPRPLGSRPACAG